MKTYLVDSARTASGNFHTHLISRDEVVTQLLWAISALKVVDQIKKSLFYGRNLPIEISGELPEKSEEMNHEDMYLVHSILGIMTEAGELGEVLVNHLMCSEGGLEHIKPKLVDETGDILWYEAMLLRLLETDFETVGEKNLAKLRKRFPDKFEERLAIHRDEAAEQSVF